MGISYSCPVPGAFDESLDALFMRSFSFGSDTVKSALRSSSFNGRDSEPTILKAFDSGKLIIEGSLSFNGREMQTKISIKSPTSKKEKPQSSPKSRLGQLKESSPETPAIEAGCPKHEAALKLQKVYKSFRTRRQLADCAVLVEQHWWKLLDFALLKRSSVSFFDIQKPESAVSKWSRARMRAAKVGKGLSKDEKAQKLALQHWLEAIDPRHRYGHNLHFYYICWLNCESKQPFFYWLDVGEGREVCLEEQCPRSKLLQQCIKYLGPKEREAYEVIVKEGKFYYKQDMKLLDTSGSPEGTKWIFVLSTSKKLYVGQKRKGLFQHSSFLAGGAASAAGRLVVENGIMMAVWPHSGHYQPTKENFQEFMNFLKENNVDLTDVKETPTEDDEESQSKPKRNSDLTNNWSELDLTTMNMPAKYGAKQRTSLVSDGITSDISIPRSLDAFETKNEFSFGNSPAESRVDGGQTAERSSNLERFQNKQDVQRSQEESEVKETDKQTICITGTNRFNSLETSLGQRHSSSTDSLMDYEESAPEQSYKYCKKNLFVEEHEEEREESVPKELILGRINSKKRMESLQLGKQLSFKWTTGAGPRIGVVRDYPSELQFRCLEQMNLSPQGTGPSRFYASPRSTTSPGIKTSEASLLKEEMQVQQQKSISDR